MIPFRINRSSRSSQGVGPGTVCRADRQRPLRPQERLSRSERRGTSLWRRRGRCGSSFDRWAGPRPGLPPAPRFPAAPRSQRPHRPGSKPRRLNKPVPPNLHHEQRPPGVRGCGGGAFAQRRPGRRGRGQPGHRGRARDRASGVPCAFAVRRAGSLRLLPLRPPWTLPAVRLSPRAGPCARRAAPSIPQPQGARSARGQWLGPAALPASPHRGREEGRHARPAGVPAAAPRHPRARLGAPLLRQEPDAPHPGRADHPGEDPQLLRDTGGPTPHPQHVPGHKADRGRAEPRDPGHLRLRADPLQDPGPAQLWRPGLPPRPGPRGHGLERRAHRPVRAAPGQLAALLPAVPLPLRQRRAPGQRPRRRAGPCAGLPGPQAGRHGQALLLQCHQGLPLP
nr:PREDICTED: collagen alpha-1(I) chain-like [Bos indicus]